MRGSQGLPESPWATLGSYSQPAELKVIQCSGQVMCCSSLAVPEKPQGDGDGTRYFTQDSELSPWPLP